MKKVLLLIFALILPGLLYAQEDSVVHKGGWNIGVWTGGGSGVSGSTKDTHLWLTGARFGKVLTQERGTGAFRGHLEYVVEAIPAFLVFQDSTVYGFDFTPLLFKWNFTASQRWTPYFEVGAGMLLTADDVPEKTYPLNFTPQAAFGMHIPTARKQAFTIAVKYMHISNASLSDPNPGINSMQVFVGYNWFH